MRRFRTTIIILAAAAGARAATVPAPLADVSMQVSRGAVLVGAMVNNRGPYTFLVDSGATACALTPDMVKWLGAPSAGEGTVSAIGTVRKAPFVRIRKLSVGGATATDLRAVVWDGQSLSRIAGQRVDGIIGTTYLWKWPVQFDFPASRFRVFPGSYDLATEPVEAPWSGVSPLRLRDRAAYVQVALNGGGARWMMLDTGASGLVIMAETAQKFGAKPSPLESWSVGAFGDRRNSRYWVLGSIRVAGLTVENAQAFTPEPWGEWPSEQFGNDAMDQFRVTVDASRSVLRLERDTVAAKFDASPWGLGISTRRVDDSRIVVEGVWLSGEAARRGIRPGDEIVNVAETAASHITDQSLKDLLTPPPGVSVPVTFRTAAGEPKDVSLVSRRYVKRRGARFDDAIATTLTTPPAPKSD